MENYLSKIVVDTCYQVHVGLGWGQAYLNLFMKRSYIMNCVSRAYKLSGNLLCQLCGMG